MRVGGRFRFGHVRREIQAHGGLTLPPTLREKAAKDGAPPVRFAFGRLGHPPEQLGLSKSTGGGFSDLLEDSAPALPVICRSFPDQGSLLHWLTCTSVLAG